MFWFLEWVFLGGGVSGVCMGGGWSFFFGCWWCWFCIGGLLEYCGDVTLICWVLHHGLGGILVAGVSWW